MKISKNAFLSLSAPFLVLISLVGLLQRQDSNRLQSIPALFIGSGLILKGPISRRRGRVMLMNSMLNSQDNYSS